MFGGTNYDAALDKALQIFKRCEGLKQRVVFFTDGQPNGNCTRFAGLCDELFRLGCEIYAIGLSVGGGGDALRNGLQAVARPRDLVFMAVTPKEVEKHFQEIGRADF